MKQKPKNEKTKIKERLKGFKVVGNIHENKKLEGKKGKCIKKNCNESELRKIKEKESTPHSLKQSIIETLTKDVTPKRTLLEKEIDNYFSKKGKYIKIDYEIFKKIAKRVILEELLPYAALIIFNEMTRYELQEKLKKLD